MDERIYEHDDISYRHRTDSRNASDRERSDKDKRYQQSNYYQQSGYNYEQYSYLQHQQYYENMRHTNPQAYAEWYKRYYSQYLQQQTPSEILTVDGRESVHSGRSSANEGKERYVDIVIIIYLIYFVVVFWCDVNNNNSIDLKAIFHDNLNYINSKFFI